MRKLVIVLICLFALFTFLSAYSGEVQLLQKSDSQPGTALLRNR